MSGELRAAELREGEWLALGGLIRAMMHADGKISRKEHRMIAELVRDLGSQLWQALAHAEQHLSSDAAVRQQASRVTRPEAQRLIREAVERMARSDGMASEEQALLDWLDALWAP